MTFCTKLKLENNLVLKKEKCMSFALILQFRITNYAKYLFLLELVLNVSVFGQKCTNLVLKTKIDVFEHGILS